MTKTLDLLIGGALVLLGAGGIFAGSKTIHEDPKKIIGYAGTAASIGAVVRGYKLFLEKHGI